MNWTPQRLLELSELRGLLVDVDGLNNSSDFLGRIEVCISRANALFRSGIDEPPSFFEALVADAVRRDLRTQAMTKQPHTGTTPYTPTDMLSGVWHEMTRALAKFPTWPTDPLHALAVLGEEFGELTKDVLQMTYEPGKTNAENVRKEAVQTAAMALRFVASLDAYIYKAGEQHRQEQWKAQQDAYAASGGLHPCYD